LEDKFGDEDDIYVDPYPQDLPLFAAEAASRGLSQKVQQAVLDGLLDAMLLLLLYYLPALRRLDLPSIARGCIIAEHILHAGPLLSGLQSVRCLCFSFVMELEPVVPFFALPALDTVVWCPHTVPKNKLNILPGLSNVKHINVLLSSLPTHILQALVRSSRSLQTFVYSHFNPHSWGTALHIPSLAPVPTQPIKNTFQKIKKYVIFSALHSFTLITIVVVFAIPSDVGSDP
jgi:hypothetical protein